MAAKQTSDIERAAAALRDEAATVLRQAALASRLGADLALSAPELLCSLDGEQASLGLPEPEGEPLLSLASPATLGGCGYRLEDEEDDDEHEGGWSPLSEAPSRRQGAMAPHFAVAEELAVEAPVVSCQALEAALDLSSEEAEDVEDVADAAEWREGRETAAELMRLLARGVFGEEPPPRASVDVVAPELAGIEPLAAQAWLTEEPQEAELEQDAQELRAAQEEQEAAREALDRPFLAEGPRSEAVAPSAVPELPALELPALEPLSWEEELLARAQHRKARVAAFLKENGYMDATAPKRTLLKTKYPIHTAAKQGDATMVQMLMEEGADPLKKTSWGKTATQIALSKNRRGSHAAVLRALGGA